MSVICSLEAIEKSDAATDPIRYLTVPIPRLGEVRFRSLSAAELRELQGKPNDYILRRSCVDENGHNWVDDEVMAKLQSEEFDGQVYLTLTNVAMKLCADEDVDSLIASAVKAAAKNSLNGRQRSTITA